MDLDIISKLDKSKYQKRSNQKLGCYITFGVPVCITDKSELVLGEPYELHPKDDDDTDIDYILYKLDAHKDQQYFTLVNYVEVYDKRYMRFVFMISVLEYFVLNYVNIYNFFKKYKFQLTPKQIGMVSAGIF